MSGRTEMLAWLGAWAAGAVVIACGLTDREIVPGDAGKRFIEASTIAETGTSHDGGGAIFDAAIDQQDVAMVSGSCGAVVNAAELFASDQQGPSRLAIDGDALYWAETTIYGDRLWRWPKSGSAPTLLGPGAGVSGLALATDHLYFAVYDNLGALFRVDKLGDSAPVEIVSGQPRSDDVAVDDNHVFWLNTGSIEENYEDGSVMRIAKSGGASITVADSQRNLAGLVLAGDAVFWTAGPPRSIWRAAKSGGSIDEIVQTSAGVVALATDGSSLFFGAPLATDDDQKPTALWRTSFDGTDTALIASGFSSLKKIHVHAGCIYAVDGTRIVRMSTEGGVATQIAVASQLAHDIALDETYLYWSEYDSGKVWRLRL